MNAILMSLLPARSSRKLPCVPFLLLILLVSLAANMVLLEFLKGNPRLCLLIPIQIQMSNERHSRYNQPSLYAEKTINKM